MRKENWYFQLKLCVITPKILLSNLFGVRIFNYLRYVWNKTINFLTNNIMAMEKSDMGLNLFWPALWILNTPPPPPPPPPGTLKIIQLFIFINQFYQLIFKMYKSRDVIKTINSLTVSKVEQEVFFWECVCGGMGGPSPKIAENVFFLYSLQRGLLNRGPICLFHGKAFMRTVWY